MNTEIEEPKDTDTKEEKLMKPSQAAKAANVNYETARKWKTAYNKDPEKKTSLKKN